MRIFKEFAEWFNKSDKNIVDFHLKKDKENLKRTLHDLEEELENMKQLRKTIDSLIKKSEEIAGTSVDKKAIKKEEHSDFRKWLKEEETILNRIFALKKDEITAQDIETLKKELPLLRAERIRLDNRIRKLLEIIAKTKFLIDDLNEDLCQQLSHGHSLAEIGKVLVEKFSHEFREDYFSGKDDICAFLHDHFKIQQNEACQLFDLLEEVGILKFKLESSEQIAQQPLLYYGTDWDDPMMEYVTIPPQLMGYWEINA